MSVGTIAVTPSRVTPKAVGITGLVLGALAWVITLPPIEVRTIVPSVILAVGGILAGTFATNGGERKLGIGTIVVALLAIGGAIASMDCRDPPDASGRC